MLVFEWHSSAHPLDEGEEREEGREKGREEIIYAQMSWNCGRVVEVVCITQYHL